MSSSESKIKKTSGTPPAAKRPCAECGGTGTVAYGTDDVPCGACGGKGS